MVKDKGSEELVNPARPISAMLFLLGSIFALLCNLYGAIALSNVGWGAALASTIIHLATLASDRRAKL